MSKANAGAKKCLRVQRPLRRPRRWSDHELSAADRVDLLDIIGGDLPDGAYFAMAEEMGLDPSDFVEGS